jgi:hypothetical protein
MSDEQLAELFAAYVAGTAITAALAESYARDGVDITVGRRILTASEFAAVAAYGRGIASTSANNVWG